MDDRAQSRQREQEDDRPEMLVKLQERKERHAERGLPARIGVVVIGVVLVILGIFLLGPGIPGPGIVVILIGLSFLALEFDRAERLLEKVIVWADNAKERAENAPRSQKIATGVIAALLLAGFVVWAILDDIPLLPIV
ncbi:MAG: PGPGW domain-containing protein [Actinomycetota bacterium]